MPPDRSSFTALNTPQSSIPESMSSFSLIAPPNTDLWRKPPQHDTATAPVLYTALRWPFVCAEVTVSADWELEWDQAGLCIFAGVPPGVIFPATTSPTSTSPVTSLSTSTAQAVPISAVKWVKASLEFSSGHTAFSSAVATADGCDWTLSPLPPHHANSTSLRIKLERIGFALWIWYEDSRDGWRKMREVTWFFYGIEDKAVRVGLYVSRPSSLPALPPFDARNRGQAAASSSRGGTRDLEVHFDGLEMF